MSFLSWIFGATQVNIAARSPSIRQTLQLEFPVLCRINKFRQLKQGDAEAGGQLFGNVTDSVIAITCATGPYYGDDRGRYHYRSNSKSAQKMIETQSRKGLLYLGEWHTHAEDHPRASGDDWDAMARLLENSKLNISQLFLLIVGRLPPPQGLLLWSIDQQTRELWNLEDEHNAS